MKRLLLCFLLAGLSSPVTAQSAAELRARAALQSAPAPGAILTQPSLDATLAPFAGTTPPESTLQSSDLDNATILRRSGTSAEARAMSNTEDSFLGRVAAPVDTGDLAAADSAVANAQSTVGGYFDPAGGLCQYSDFGSVAPFKRFCDRSPSFDANTCRVSRVVTVDRTDTWACDIQNPDYQQDCSETPQIACTPTPACETTSLTVSLPIDWSETQVGNTRQWDATRPTSGACRTRDQSFTFDISSDWQISSAVISGLTYSQFTQIQVNGTILDTWPFGGTGGDLYKRSTGFWFWTKEGPAIAGSYLTTNCNASIGSAAPGLDIAPNLNQPLNPGLSGSATATNTIRVISVGTAPFTEITFALTGPCCDGLQLTKVKTCTPVSR